MAPQPWEIPRPASNTKERWELSPPGIGRMWATMQMVAAGAGERATGRGFLEVGAGRVQNDTSSPTVGSSGNMLIPDRVGGFTS